jgi:hypothetical protein
VHRERARKAAMGKRRRSARRSHRRPEQSFSENQQ